MSEDKVEQQAGDEKPAAKQPHGKGKKRPCGVARCDKDSYAWGLCLAHYRRRMRGKASKAAVRRYERRASEAGEDQYLDPTLSQPTPPEAPPEEDEFPFVDPQAPHPAAGKMSYPLIQSWVHPHLRARTPEERKRQQDAADAWARQVFRAGWQDDPTIQGGWEVEARPAFLHTPQNAEPSDWSGMECAQCGRKIAKGAPPIYHIRGAVDEPAPEETAYGSGTTCTHCGEKNFQDLRQLYAKNKEFTAEYQAHPLGRYKEERYDSRTDPVVPRPALQAAKAYHLPATEQRMLDEGPPEGQRQRRRWPLIVPQSAPPPHQINERTGRAEPTEPKEKRTVQENYLNPFIAISKPSPLLRPSLTGYLDPQPTREAQLWDEEDQEGPAGLGARPQQGAGRRGLLDDVLSGMEDMGGEEDAEGAPAEEAVPAERPTFRREGTWTSALPTPYTQGGRVAPPAVAGGPTSPPGSPAWAHAPGSLRTPVTSLTPPPTPEEPAAPSRMLPTFRREGDMIQNRPTPPRATPSIPYIRREGPTMSGSVYDEPSDGDAGAFPLRSATPLSFPSEPPRDAAADAFPLRSATPLHLPPELAQEEEEEVPEQAAPSPPSAPGGWGGEWGGGWGGEWGQPRPVPAASYIDPATVAPPVPEGLSAADRAAAGAFPLRRAAAPPIPKAPPAPPASPAPAAPPPRRFRREGNMTQNRPTPPRVTPPVPYIQRTGPTKVTPPLPPQEPGSATRPPLLKPAMERARRAGIVAA